VYTVLFNLLLSLNHKRDFYFDNPDSWFRKWTSITNTLLAGQKNLDIEAPQVQRFKAAKSDYDWELIVENIPELLIDMFGEALDEKILSNNNLVVSMDDLLRTHDYTGEAASPPSFHSFFYDMIATHDVYVSQIDGQDFNNLPDLRYNQRTTLTEDDVLKSHAVIMAGLHHEDGVHYTHTDVNGESPERKPFPWYTERNAALLFVNINSGQHWGVLWPESLVKINDGGLQKFIDRVAVQPSWNPTMTVEDFESDDDSNSDDSNSSSGDGSSSSSGIRLKKNVSTK
jgi:hypothetical protein